MNVSCSGPDWNRWSITLHINFCVCRLRISIRPAGVIYWCLNSGCCSRAPLTGNLSGVAYKKMRQPWAYGARRACTIEQMRNAWPFYGQHYGQEVVRILWGDVVPQTPLIWLGRPITRSLQPRGRQGSLSVDKRLTCDQIARFCGSHATRFLCFSDPSRKYCLQQQAIRSQSLFL